MRGGLKQSVSLLAVLAAGGLFTAGGMLAPQPAQAADLGGDCCADLEERVATLEATTAHKGNRKVSLAISGRVHANMMYWNDGGWPLDPAVAFDNHSDVYFGNTGGSGTNIVLSGAAAIGADHAAGFSMTLADDFSGTDSQTTHQTGPVIGGDTTYVFLTSKTLGELRLGNLASASDNAYYLNYGAATVGGLSGARFVGNFRLRDTSGALTDVTYSQLLHEWSDNNENRLMYISPMFGGFKYYSDIGGDDTASAALTWVGKFNTLHAEAGIGYETSSRSDGVTGQAQFATTAPATASTAFVPLTDAANSTLRLLGLSGSIFDTASGLFASGEYSRAYAAAAGRQDITNWFVEAGWQKNVSGLGITSVYAQYMRQDNGLRNDTTAHLFGIGIDQAIDAAASNVYVHYQRDVFDGAVAAGVASRASDLSKKTAAPLNAQAVDSVTGGMIIRF